MKRFISILLCSVMAIASVAGCSSSQKSSDAQVADDAKGTNETSETSEKSGNKASFSKIALLLPGVITDQSWNTNAYNGLQQLIDEGYDCTYTESVANADIESTFRIYADQGYELIIGHGSQFGDAAIAVAPDYPDQYFFVVGNQPAGTECPKNVGFIYNTGAYVAYMAGACAALNSKSGTIGYLGGIESDSQLAMKFAYMDGAKHVNPNINVIDVMAGTFDDSALGKEAAKAMIEQGADVLTHTCDTTGLGLIEAAKEANVKIIGYGTDQSSLAPDLVLTSIVEDIPTIIASLPNRIEDGVFGGLWTVQLDDHIKYLSDYASFMPENIKTQLDDLYAKVASGEIEVVERYK